jgi:hypothetical protein
LRIDRIDVEVPKNLNIITVAACEKGFFCNNTACPFLIGLESAD